MQPSTVPTRRCQNPVHRDVTYQIVLDIDVTANTQVCIRMKPGSNRSNSPDILASAHLFYIFMENLLKLIYFNFFQAFRNILVTSVKVFKAV
jgi:hypothetical protein